MPGRAILGALAWSLSGLGLAGGPGRLFRLGGVIVGLLTVLPALLHLYLEAPRKGSLAAVLLITGAVAFGSLGLAHIGWAEPWQIAFGYLTPSGLMMMGAAIALALPRARMRFVPG